MRRLLVTALLLSIASVVGGCSGDVLSAPPTDAKPLVGSTSAAAPRAVKTTEPRMELAPIPSDIQSTQAPKAKQPLRPLPVGDDPEVDAAFEKAVESGAREIESAVTTALLQFDERKSDTVLSQIQAELEAGPDGE